MNDELVIPGVKVRLFDAEVATANTTSDGELTRVGTFPLRGSPESLGT